MARPDIIDESLGRLRYDKQLSWYEGQVNVHGEAVRFNLHPDASGDVAPAAARARKVLTDFDRYARAAKDYAAEQLLDLKNNSWLDEGEEPVDPEHFKERMALDAVVFNPEGDVTFYHQDGDLFWGHCIEIGMDSEDRFVHADIPG